MSPQTEDNLRCLGAAIALLVGLAAFAATGPEWGMELPGWILVVAIWLGFGLVAYIFNWRGKSPKH